MSEMEGKMSFAELGIHIPADNTTDLKFRYESVERREEVLYAAEVVNASMTDAQRRALQEAGEIYKDMEQNPPGESARRKRAGDLIAGSYTPVQVEPRPREAGLPPVMDTEAEGK